MPTRRRDKAVDIGVVAEQRLDAAEIAEFFPRRGTTNRISPTVALPLALID